jgi:PPOX class probable F420-dependent enzyme
MTAAARTATGLTDAARDLIGRQSFLMLATRNADATIHAVPLIYLFDGERFLMATPPASRKARNIAVRPDVTVTVEDRTDLGWVSAQGRAELIDGPPSRALNERVYRTWMTEEGVDVVGGMMADVTIAVTPRRWSSWDIETGFYTYLRGAGIPLDRPERWFR